MLEKYPGREYIVKGITAVLCQDAALIQGYLLPVLTFLFLKYVEEPDRAVRKGYMHSILAALKTFKETPLGKLNVGIVVEWTRTIWPKVKQVLVQPLRIKDDEDSDI